ncbi:MAG: nuclear transport factor 2 family protein [Pseudomonadota bacterium]
MVKHYDNDFENGGWVRFSSHPKADMPHDAETTDAVLAANEAFYAAFAGADFAAMETVWGQSGSIAVEHPGGAGIKGRNDVLESWRAILRAPPPITCTVEDVISDEEQWAVICQEDLGRVVLRMVNVFRKEEGEWKMIYHGPTPSRALNS